MSKQCINCNSQLDDNAQFCGSCGTAQNCAEVPQEKKKAMKWIIAAGAAVCVAVLVIVLLMSGGSKPKGLMKVENIETELTDAYTRVFGDFRGDAEEAVVTDFIIFDEEGENYDQRFACTVDRMLDISGIIKDGAVTEIKTSMEVPDDGTLDVESKAFMMALSAFTAAIFDEEIQNYIDLSGFILEMDGDLNYMVTAVKGDIEYTLMPVETNAGFEVWFYTSYEPSEE